MGGVSRAVRGCVSGCAGRLVDPGHIIERLPDQAPKSEVMVARHQIAPAGPFVLLDWAHPKPPPSLGSDDPQLLQVVCAYAHPTRVSLLCPLAPGRRKARGVCEDFDEAVGSACLPAFSTMEVIDMDDLFDDQERVATPLGCPTCAEVRMARLDWYDPGAGPFSYYEDEYVWCRSCGTAYDPNHDRILGNSSLGI